jgi:hypothetical protein
MMKSLFNLLFLPMILAGLLSCDSDQQQTEISRAFEFRYASGNPSANGVTDFKGPTAVFDTAERIDYLGKFASYAKKFFNDPRLNTQVVNEDEIESAIKRLKPQPKPKIRQEIAVDSWKYLGYKAGQHKEEMQQIEIWKQFAGAKIQDEALLLSPGHIEKSFSPQDWRMQFSWRFKPLEENEEVTFSFSEVARAGIDKTGKFFYFAEGERRTTSRKSESDKWYQLKVEIDLESGRYNFYVNKELLADFVVLDSIKQKITGFSIQSGQKILLDDLWGVGYELHERGSRTHPYFINTFTDQDFAAPPTPEGFEKPGYDDTEWDTVPYRRYAHGGERNRDEVLYLRRMVEAEDFEQARLNVETIRPSGEIFINGKSIGEAGRLPQTLDVTDELNPDEKNLIAVKVHPYEVEEVKHHMSTDKWSSWFAGLIHLELTSRSYIKNAFAYTTSIDEAATEQLYIMVHSDDTESFEGKLVTKFYPWYPQEDDKPAGRSTSVVKLKQGESAAIEETVRLKDPKLWTAQSPNLYKIRIELQDSKGNPVDDYVFTTGIRTISQEDGSFRINGKPEVLFGPLVFNQSWPLEKVSQWMFSPPKSKWVETILETKKMNGNAIRMSVHDKRVAGVNDKRLAQIGDQMGIMFIWQTPHWFREGGIEAFDANIYARYMKNVRNHPSIITWQPGNHPRYSPEWYGGVLERLSQADPGRLISPAADIATHMVIDSFPGDDNNSAIPNWTHPQLARGNMEQTTSYGVDWSDIRKLGSAINEKVADLNDRVRVDYLNSDTHAWFDYESEETIGQPNWNLHKGKPYYHMYSYEKDYNIGNIGRILEFSEWQESQAWQALTACEAYRKKRWLDYDGMTWCPLRGGPNTATYMKPVIEYSGEAKLSYYALQMVYQPVLAGSKNVDLVYGPEDAIPVVVMNRDKPRTVDIEIVVKNMNGELVAQKTFPGIKLESGRTVTDIGKWKPGLEPGKYYGFEYRVVE